MKKLFCIIFLFVILPVVSGLGVSPGKIEIDFSPNLKTSFNMTVYNSPARNQDVKLYVGFSALDSDLISEFENIISLDTESFSFTEQDTTKIIKVNINFPEGFSTSGIHELRIGAIKDVSAEGEGISIVAGNEVRILIKVPQEYASNKYSRIKRLRILNIYADDIEVGGKSNINVLVKSESDVKLEDVSSKIKVMDGNNLIEILETNKIALDEGEEGDLETVFYAKRVKPGILILDVEVFYDSKSEKGTGSLKIIELGSGTKTEVP